MELPGTYKQTIFETQRLYLKELNPDIVGYVFTSFTDEDIKTYLGLTNEELAVEKYKFEKGLTTFQTSFRKFLIVSKADDRVMGKCGFHTWFFNHSRAEIGYGLMREEDRGKGFMTEAMQLVIRYGFEEMKLNRIEAFVGPTNIASLRLVNKLGFTEEGTLREHYYKYPRLEDSVCFSLLKKEYEKVKDTIYKTL
jgi:ribosomal-protein-alanine N-acetyltransferase